MFSFCVVEQSSGLVALKTSWEVEANAKKELQTIPKQLVGIIERAVEGSRPAEELNDPLN